MLQIKYILRLITWNFYFGIFFVSAVGTEIESVKTSHFFLLIIKTVSRTEKLNTGFYWGFIYFFYELSLSLSPFISAPMTDI